MLLLLMLLFQQHGVSGGLQHGVSGGHPSPAAASIGVPRAPLTSKAKQQVQQPPLANAGGVHMLGGAAGLQPGGAAGPQPGGLKGVLPGGAAGLQPGGLQGVQPGGAAGGAGWWDAGA
ncbi:hypothetical protein V8C86DRAFT_1438593 [Haematococcus lacustris]